MNPTNNIESPYKMARPKPAKVRGLLFEHGSYVVRMVVPVDVRASFEKVEFRQNLRTENATVAAREALKLTAMWKGWIKKARAGESHEEINKLVAQWKATQTRQPYSLTESVTPENELLRLLYLAVSGSAASGVDQVAEGIGLTNSEPARLAITKALMEVEQSRILNGRADVAVGAANAAMATASGYERNAFGVATKVQPITEMSGWSIDSFYKKWAEERNTSDARLPHEGLYLRALKDFMGGDCDLATITRMKVFDFWRQVAKFPARRDRHADPMTFTQMIKVNDQAQGTPAWREPLGASTQKNWLKFYNQMFTRAADLEIIKANPFKAVKIELPDGQVTGEALTSTGIEKFFSHEFFSGERDARWWLRYSRSTDALQPGD